MSSAIKLEAAFGITQYISSHNGFHGVLKQRFSDFHVNEISSSGEVIHLTSTDVIDPPVASVPKSQNKPEELSDTDIEILKVMSGQKHSREFKPTLFLNRESEKPIIEKSPPDFSHLKISVEGMSKETRTAIHQFIKSQFNNLNSTTKEFDKQKFIYVTKKADATKIDRRRGAWPKSQSHVHFVLYKENIDTMEAVNLIAGKLRLKPSQFCYAGTKDKRAKTSQVLSINQVAPDRLSSAAKALRGIYVGNFHFRHIPQKLGQLRGNFFRITLREVDGSDETITTAVSSVKTNGFINYFGTQRFSSTDVPTHLIGKAILRCNWKEVRDLILQPREKDFHDIAAAKRIWFSEKDPKKSLEALKPMRRHSIEGLLLSGLAEYGEKNVVSALDKIPRNTRMLYVHAYQSYIWNTVISRRFKEHGLNVLTGDLIQNKEKCSGNINENVQSEDSLTKGEKETENQNEGETANSKVIILSEAAAKQVDITQVVMPLPGFNSVYPGNEIKSWYQELLHKDGLTFESFKHCNKAYAVGGAYRHIVVHPEKFQHQIRYYNDPQESLIQSDVEALNNTNVGKNILTSGQYKAVVLQFSLPSSSYATMALRELLKMETSSKFQATLNSSLNVKSDHTKETSEDSGDQQPSICSKRKSLEIEKAERKNLKMSEALT